MIPGFDASGWSREVDFEGAKAHGMQYGIYRVGRGIPDGATSSQGIDNKWFDFKRKSLQAGLKTGGYWRFFPSVDLNTQLDRFCLALGQVDGMLSPWVDVEDHGNMTPGDLTNWTIRALIGVEQRTGRRPILYTGKSFYDTRLQYWRLSNWELAIAWQIAGKWVEYGACFWQHHLDTPVPWASGNVDLQTYAYNDMLFNTFQNDLKYQFDEDGLLHGPMVWSGKLLPESGQQGSQSNDVAIVHTMVGYLNGTDSSFRNPDNGLESHLGIGGRYDGEELDGAIYQWMKIGERADANWNGNPYAFSIETSDGTRYLEKWTGIQSESLAQSIAAWCLRYKRPAQMVTRSHHSAKGIGHHRIGTVPYPQPGDDYWSPPSQGPRACPGQPRIDQLAGEVIPRVQSILLSIGKGPAPGGPEVPPEESDMKLEDVIGQTPEGNPITVREALMCVMDIKTTLDTHDDSISTELHERINGLRASLNSKLGQSTWGELATATWGELNTQRWGKLASIT